MINSRVPISEKTLRNLDYGSYECQEAAAEIRRLRAENAELRKQLEPPKPQIVAGVTQEEIDPLYRMFQNGDASVISVALESARLQRHKIAQWIDLLARMDEAIVDASYDKARLAQSNELRSIAAELRAHGAADPKLSESWDG